MIQSYLRSIIVGNQLSGVISFPCLNRAQVTSEGLRRKKRSSVEQKLILQCNGSGSVICEKKDSFQMQQSTFSPQGTTVGLQIGENAETEENMPGFLRWKISESVKLFENERIFLEKI